MADAIPYAPARPSRLRAFERLKGADVLRTDGTGKWWLDDERWSGRRSDRRTKAVFALLAEGGLRLRLRPCAELRFARKKAGFLNPP